MSNTQIAPCIRWLIRRDLSRVEEIEDAVYQWDAWTHDDFERTIRQRNVIPMACEIDDEVVGYVIRRLFGKRLHIESLVVAPEHQRRGIGRTMIDYLKMKLTQHRRNKITVRVSECNLPGQLFFRSMGFVSAGIDQDYWGKGPDAYRMIYRHGWG